ncbi:PLPL3 acyltransferase, partial [Nothoprocta ornata]|nr:PLPL3 acyltransferase [Nothoprocta pentlandii]NWY03268.1 PLPL3 acyltransferase [Nothoprocta ornata]
PLSILFRGCGFMLIYEIGVLKALTELSPEILRSAPKIYGVSSGSFVAAVAVCGCDVGKGSALSFILYVQRGQYGTLEVLVNVLHALRICLRKFLPTNAHQLASGRLHIVLTRVRGWKNVVISEFASKEDIIQAVICSCFIPLYFGFIPPLYHGVRYIDGEFAMGKARFVSEATITVCSFMGEYDICPRETPAAFFFLQASSYVLQISKANLYRIWCAF